MTENSFPHQLVGSPCCLPEWSYEDLMQAYRDIGFTKFEAFSEWARARLDWHEDPAIAQQKAHAAGIAITSFHLPLIGAHNVELGLENAIVAARYAQTLGARVVLFKAASKEVFGQIGIRFLDALDKEGIACIPVLQNHYGTAISTVDDYQEVFDRLGNDPRLKAVLEVGHFYRAGISWQTGWDFLSDRIALIHVNEIQGGQSVHYGSGEVDFAGLIRKVKTANYRGEIVVELELENRDTNPQETLEGLRNAMALLTRLYAEA